MKLCVVMIVACLSVPGMLLAAEPPKDTVKPAPAAAAGEVKRVGDPYPLATCPVSGKKLGEKGDPVVKLYDGREVRFCCSACPAEFEKDLPKSLTSLDAAMVKDQLALYPMNASVVSGKKFDEKVKPVDFIYGNRLVRLAGEGEKADFLKDPTKYVDILDKATVAAQEKSYTMTTCPVSEEKLGEMGEPRNLVVAGRLIRLCCKSCVKDVMKDPAKFIALVDDARKAKVDPHADHHGK
jgi:YHS domain-containing protein